MKRASRSFKFLSVVLSILCFTSCSRPSAPPHLTQEAMLLSETVKMLWLTDAQEAPDNILFVNVQSGSERPPQLDGMLLNPSTSIEYLYVRTWVGGEAPKAVRRMIGAFVLKDISSGALVRGSIRDGAINVEPLSRYQFQKFLNG